MLRDGPRCAPDCLQMVLEFLIKVLIERHCQSLANFLKVPGKHSPKESEDLGIQKHHALLHFLGVVEFADLLTLCDQITDLSYGSGQAQGYLFVVCSRLS